MLYYNIAKIGSTRIFDRIREMNRLVIVFIMLLALLTVYVYPEQPAASTDGKANSADSSKSEFQEIEWADLEPTGESPLPINPTHDSPSFEGDSAVGQYGADPGSSSAYMSMRQAYSSSRVVSDMDGKAVRIPGFVVPIEFEGNSVTEFFLVPYFGACYHMPPPPPNQIIYVESSDGIKFESIYDPVWLEGVMETKQRSNAMAMAAYSMKLHSLEAYTY